MFSLSTWIWLIERNDLVDFVPNGYDKILLALTPQRPKIDFGLFVRCHSQTTSNFGSFMYKSNHCSILKFVSLGIS